MITYPNLYHLRYFVDAVELGSVSSAAKKNLVTHPAISRAIKAIESYLNISLVDHRKKSFLVTKEGFRVAEQAKVLLAAAKDFDKLNLQKTIQEIPRLSIGISRSLTNAYLSHFLKSMNSEFPGIQIQIRFGTTNDLITSVANKSIDLGLTIGTRNLPTLKQSILKKGEFLLIEGKKALPPNKNHLQKRDLSKDLVNKNFLLTEPRYETEKLKQDFKKEFNRPLITQYEVSSWEVLGEIIRKGEGVALLPDILVNDWPKNTYKIINSSDWFQCSYEICMHTVRDQIPHRVIDRAREILKNI